MKMILSLALGIFILSGCSLQNHSEESNVATVHVNGEWYDALGNEEPEKYTLGKELGKVKDKVSPDNTKPSGNFESNYLNEGIRIFSSNEDKNIILAEIKNGSYQSFEKRFKDTKK